MKGQGWENVMMKQNKGLDGLFILFFYLLYFEEISIRTVTCFLFKINLSCCVVHLCFSIPMNILFRLLFVASSAKNLILLSPLRTPVSTFNLDKQHFHLSFLKKKHFHSIYWFAA